MSYVPARGDTVEITYLNDVFRHVTSREFKKPRQPVTKKIRFTVGHWLRATRKVLGPDGYYVFQFQQGQSDCLVFSPWSPEKNRVRINSKLYRVEHIKQI